MQAQPYDQILAQDELDNMFFDALFTIKMFMQQHQWIQKKKKRRKNPEHVS